MKRMNRVFILFLFLILCGWVVIAHELWLVPQKFFAEPNESISIFANTGHEYPVSVSAVTPDRISRFLVAGPKGKEEITDFRIQGKSLAVDVKFDVEGTHVIGLAVMPRGTKLAAENFNRYLLHNGLRRIYEIRKRKGILDKDAVEVYSKYPKTIIQVGREINDVPLKSLGLPLEIIPAVNPYSLREGDNLEIKVLLSGQPLAGAETAWHYPGTGKEYAGFVTTGQDGCAVVPLERSGPYIIRLIHMEWVRRETHEWESLWASLTFEVLPL